MADRKLNIQVAFSALDNLSRPVSVARQSAAALASQIRQTQSNIKGLERQASSFDRLTAANKKTTDQLAQAKTQAREMAGAFGPLRQRSAEQVTALNQQRAAIRNLKHQQKAERAQLDQLRASFYREGVAIRSSSRATEQISQRTAQYNRYLAEQKRRLESVTQAQARYSRAREASQKMTSGGVKAAAAGAGMLYASQRIMSPGLDFDQRASKVQGLTRLDKNSAEMKALRSEARRLGATTAFTAGDAASGQAFLAMAGFTPQAIRQALPGILNMALAGDVDLGEGADIGSNVLGQFNLGADNMDRVSDVLTATFTRTNTDLRQLAQTMVYAGPVAAGLGVDLETMSAMSGKLADMGIRGSMAGTGLKSTLIRLAAPTKKAQKALSTLGVSAADASGKMLPVETLLTCLYQKAKKFSQVEQVGFWKAIAGEEAAVSLQTLVQAAGRGTLQHLISDLRRAQGDAARTAAIMADNLGGDLKRMQSAWQDLGLEIEESIDSPLRHLAQRFTALISAVSGWMKGHPQMTTAITLSVLAIGAMAAGMGALALAVGSVLVPLALMRLSFTMLAGSGAALVIPSVTRLTGSLRALLPSLSGVGRSIRDWPLVLRAAAAGLKRIGGQAFRVVMTGLSALARGAAVAGMALVTVFTQPMTAITLLGGGLTDLARNGFLALMNSARTVFMALTGGLSLLLSPVGILVTALVVAGVAVVKFWAPIKAFFTGFFRGLTEGSGQVFTAFKSAFAPLAPVFNVIGDAISRVWNGFTRLIRPVQFSGESLHSATRMGIRFGKFVGEALASLVPVIQSIADGVSWILEKLGLIPDAATRAQEAIEKANAQQKLARIADTLAGDMKAVAAQAKEAEEKKEHQRKAEQNLQHQMLAEGLKGPSNLAPKISGSLDKIASNTAEKKDGPGEIVFKNKQMYIPIRGGYAEPLQRTQQQALSLTTWVQQQINALVPKVMPYRVRQPVARPPNSAVLSAASVATLTPRGDTFNFEITINSTGQMDEKKLVRRIREEFIAARQQAARRRLSQLTDHE